MSIFIDPVFFVLFEFPPHYRDNKRNGGEISHGGEIVGGKERAYEKGEAECDCDWPIAIRRRVSKSTDRLVNRGMHLGEPSSNSKYCVLRWRRIADSRSCSAYSESVETNRNY